MDQDSSDEEDVFCCGRCKENFSSVASFMEHKKSQPCQKTKHRPLESQQHNLSPPSGMLISLSGRVTEDDTRETIQESTSSIASQDGDLNPVSAVRDPEYSPQSSVARLQDVLTMLQGGHQTDQLDLSLETSEPQDSQAVLHVFERILIGSSQNGTLPAMRTDAVISGSVEGGHENLPSEEAPSADLPGISDALRGRENIADQTVFTISTGSKSFEGADSYQDDAGLLQKSISKESTDETLGVVCSETEQNSGRQQLVRETGSKDGSQEVQAKSSLSSKVLPEQANTADTVMCKFCSETMTNGDVLFSHYMEVHKMKSGAALEFLRQSAFKRKRGRPPKGLACKQSKPIVCPHCHVSFNSKTLCAAHIRNHHRKKKGTPSASKVTSLPSGRLRKCSRCSYRTTTAKDLTAHIHSCHSSRPDAAYTETVEKILETCTKPSRSTSKTKPLESKPKTQRGRKKLKRVKEDVVTIMQDLDVFNDSSGDVEDDEEDEIEDEQDTNDSGKAQVNCPECNKKMRPHGLKRHQVRCANKNRYVCPLCQHKSRESYDHTVHVDNHKIWVKSQTSWIDTTFTGSKLEATVTTEAAASSDNTPHQIPLDSNSMLSDSDKVDYATTVDLEALALIAQIQDEGTLLQEDQQLLTSESSKDAEQDVQKSEMPPVPLLHQGFETDSGRTVSPSVEQEPKCIDGRDKKQNPRDLKCKICYTWFSRTGLSKHMLQVHNLVKRFQCRVTLCKLVFAKLDDFKIHVALHSTVDMFRCGCRGCVKRRLITPETMDNLRKEKMRDYYKHMSHKCSKCWVKFPSQGSLDRHMKRESHNHPCDMCGKIQVSKRQLRMHMVTHQAERAYLCEVCGQNFKTKRDLNKHTFSHNNIRPYQCPNCAKCFSFRNKMNRHMVTVHSAKKPFTCDWPKCDKAFSRKDKLADHRKTHLISYPFKCQYCAKGFYRRDNLKDHEILHTREFPFRCADCNRGFMRPKILERHRLTDHAAVTTQITLQASITQDAQSDSPGQSISYVLCEPYVYASIDQFTTFQDHVQDAEVQLMQGQRATIEAIQSAAAAVIGNGQAQFPIDDFGT